MAKIHQHINIDDFYVRMYPNVNYCSSRLEVKMKSLLIPLHPGGGGGGMKSLSWLPPSPAGGRARGDGTA